VKSEMSSQQSMAMEGTAILDVRLGRTSLSVEHKAQLGSGAKQLADTHYGVVAEVASFARNVAPCTVLYGKQKSGKFKKFRNNPKNGRAPRASRAAHTHF